MNPARENPLRAPKNDLHDAVFNGSTEGTIAAEQESHVSIAKDGGTTALHVSARYGYLAVTVDLVKAGADPDARTSENVTPLHLHTWLRRKHIQG